ncbi:F-box domain-containing protein [Orpheovirus IHUMI-LCC2]|uniref:F-box domain-containing protein n=1 Tax=Orpheovirus IHUMI-LCC2 TaxID=2023057 RepID=A0A2I2L4P7_9VIRU|nr:F-box domain-containing protein [Orpheovirus IHUMI-LCC2]SNW62439.1 F-box domain-containing protein [Orpheovirus IHUMI-LCC2]
MEIILNDIIVNEILTRLTSYELLNFAICNKHFNTICNKFWRSLVINKSSIHNKNIDWKEEYKKLYIKFIPIVYNGDIIKISVLDYYDTLSLNFIHRDIYNFIKRSTNYCIILLSGLHVVSVYNRTNLLFNYNITKNIDRILLIDDNEVMDTLLYMNNYICKYKLNDIVINGIFSWLSTPPIYGVVDEGILRIVKRHENIKPNNRLLGIPIYSKYNIIPWYQYDISSLISIFNILYSDTKIGDIKDKNTIRDMIYNRLYDIGHLITLY